MKLIRLGHACVRLEKDGAALVIDPGIWRGAWSGEDALSGAKAVLITHEHYDHMDTEAVRGALAGDEDLELWTVEPVAGQFAEFGERVHAVAHGERFTTAGFEVRAYGQDHAQIHADVPIVANTGFVVDGEIFHPGDSYTVPGERVSTLLLPVSGPWHKTSEMIDYGREVAPRRALAIHDGLLNDNGIGLTQQMLQLAAGPIGADFSWVEPGTAIDL
ncbi:MAG TPA: MBL fold metallo-hydrolase [Streptosporangiaceae bacterium]|nr:MBL fold metallo-hydrolase [Streptosporangiaceae bacterium]